MIDNRTAGKCIAKLRVSRSMTQQGLAAALNVSHQAVSKWETGAALPDMQVFLSMSKLFGVTMEQILTGEAGEEVRPSLRKRIMDMIGGTSSEEDQEEDVLDEDEPDMDESDVDDDMDVDVEVEVNVDVDVDVGQAEEDEDSYEEQQAEKADAADKGLFDIGETVEHALEGLGPMIEGALSAASNALETAGSAVASAVRRKPAEPEADVSLTRIRKLAPFMGKAALDQLVRRYAEQEEVDWQTIVSLAPFLGRDSLSYLCEICRADDVDSKVIVRLAPFLGREALVKLIEREDGDMDWDMVQRLAPYLGRDIVDRLALKLAFGNDAVPTPPRPAAPERPARPAKRGHEDKRSLSWRMLLKALDDGNASWVEEHPEALNDLLTHVPREEKDRILGMLVDNDSMFKRIDFSEIIEDSEAAAILAMRAIRSGKLKHLDFSEIVENLETYDLTRVMRAIFEHGLETQVDIAELAEHLEEEGVEELANLLLDAGRVDLLGEVTEHLEEDALSGVALRMAQMGRWDALARMIEHLDEDTLAELAEKAISESKWDVLRQIEEVIGD